MPLLAAVTVAFPAPAAAAPTQDPEIAAALVAAKKSGHSVSVTARATEYADLAANPDGTLTWNQGSEPRRVRRSGGWVPVDLTLEKRADGSVGPKASPVDVRLAAGGGTAATGLAVAAKDGREVGIGWSGQLPQARLAGAVATYSDVLPGVDLAVTAKTGGFSQVLVVKTAEAARDPRLKEISFPSYTRGVTLRHVSGRLEAVDGGGKVVFRGDASRMWDSTGQANARAAGADTGSERPATATMDVKLTDSAVVVRPDQRFMADPARVFPIVIDPEYSWAGEKQNHVMVQSAWADDRNYNRTDNDLADLKAGYQSGYVSRSYFDFDVSPMQGKVIQDASVRVRVAHSWSCGGGPTELWSTDSIGPDTTYHNQPTWYQNLGGIWTSNHIQYCRGDGYARVGIKETMADAAAEGTSELTFMLKAASEGQTNDWRRFDIDPVLEVVYNSIPEDPAELSMEGGQIPCVTGDKRPVVFTATPRLRGLLTDPDSGTLNATFGLHKGPVGNSTEIWMGSTGDIPSDTYAEVTVPAGLLTEDGIYNWSMVSDDGDDASEWVGNCEFEVDHTAPGVPTVSSMDYPSGETPSGGIGQTGSFTFNANGTADVQHFLWSVNEKQNDDPKTKAKADRPGGGASVRWTPTLATPQTMFVRSVDRAGNLSPIVKYRFTVRSGDPLDGNLAGYWKLDGTLDDASGNSRTLTAAAGATATAEGYAGSSAGLDGTAKRLYRSGQVVDTKQSFSVSAWAKLDRPGVAATVLSADGARTSAFHLQATADGKWAFGMYTTDADGTGSKLVRAVSTEPVQVGAWTQLVGAYDAGAGMLRLYVNGAQATEKAHRSTWTAAGDFQVGAGWRTATRVELFPGQIDEVRAYQRVIVPSEAALMANQAVLRAQYQLDEGTGTTTRDQVSGQNAKLNGTAGWTQADGYPAAKFTGGFGSGYGSIVGPRPTMRTDRSYTVSSWVRLDALDSVTHTAVSFKDSKFAPFMLQYRPELKKWNFLVSLGADQEGAWWIPADTSVAAGQWVLLTGVYDHAAREARVYVDGIFAGKLAGVDGWNGNGDIMIGGGPWVGNDTDPFRGAVRGVRVYSGTLSDREISQLPAQN
ncbi:LamG-like jellyroll fold domain-containing protein [Amycolatopsis sp. NPDC059657]|uniref:LamG-like jellyroll fold domain-containing protein n=1 Tax=Amycolatopsis sp. NPDC059657 TaxID=3346899 RepID=UPI003671841A